MDKLEQVKQRIDKFNKDWDWDKFHSLSIFESKAMHNNFRRS